MKKVQHLQKYHCQWTLLRGKKPKWISKNFGNLLCPLELVPASRERVVPTEWQVRTVLGDCISKAKVISIQAPRHRQYSLISDFLDLANLSIRKEAAFTTNWNKDRPEGLKLQNQSYDVNFCRMCTSSAVCYFRASSVAILTSLLPAVNPLLGCSSGKQFQDQFA